MAPRIEELTRSLTFVRNPGASEAKIGSLLEILDVKLPEDYLDFLRALDGAEGPIGERGYLALYSIERVIECNKNYKEWVPWLVFFGTSGSLSGYGFDTRSPGMPVLELDWIGLDSSPVYLCGMSFLEFLEHLANDEEPGRLGPHPPPL